MVEDGDGEVAFPLSPLVRSKESGILSFCVVVVADGNGSSSVCSDFSGVTTADKSEVTVLILVSLESSFRSTLDPLFVNLSEKNR